MKRALAMLAAAAMLGCAPMASESVALHGLSSETLAAMRADAAQRTSRLATAVLLVTVQPVTWPDASMGCPQPGMAYAQLLLPGWQVRIEAGDQRLGYHAERGGRWLMCPAQRAQPPLATGS